MTTFHDIVEFFEANPLDDSHNEEFLEELILRIKNASAIAQKHKKALGPNTSKHCICIGCRMLKELVE